MGVAKERLPSRGRAKRFHKMGGPASALPCSRYRWACSADGKNGFNSSSFLNSCLFQWDRIGRFVGVPVSSADEQPPGGGGPCALHSIAGSPAQLLFMNCDGIARWYRLLEYIAFGRALERRRREYISDVADARRVLILGDGDGRFTAEFLRRSAAVSIDSVDLSARMLGLAERRVRAYSSGPARARFHHGDARTVNLPEKYDLIVSHFFLDCFTPDEMSALVARIAEAACPRARWLISEFALPVAGIWRWAAVVLIRMMYLFFRVSTGLRAGCLPDYAPHLMMQGFRCVRHKSIWGGLLISQLWERTL